jgi:hypothetical protein
LFLKFSLEECLNFIKGWSTSEVAMMEFPMLFSIAMDYLLIQICTVQDASETREEKEEKGTWPGRVYPFSNSGHTLVASGFVHSPSCL